MKIADCMTRDVKTITPDRSIQDAAKIMAESDVGAVPVGENDRLVGLITDRDIAVRAVCEGKSANTPVRDVMSDGLLYCFEDEDVEHVTRNMGDQKIRRLPVMDRNKRLVGIVALGDLACARNAREKSVSNALRDISQPGGLHSQAA